MEKWREISSFNGYSVSNCGRVRNDDTGRLMTLLRNREGIVNVGLTKGKVQYKRSVTRLVALGFLSKVYEAFDTPINLDGDRCNNHVDNLAWRPRWFAIEYNKQFRYYQASRGTLLRPVRDLKTGEVFESSWDAAIRYGLLRQEILLAIHNRTYVWPTYQQFDFEE